MAASAIKGILLVTAYTIPEFSGSGINAFHLGAHLSRREYNVTLLSFNRQLKLPGRELVEKVNIRRIPYFNKTCLQKIFSLFIILPEYIIHVNRNRTIIIYGGHVIGYQLIILISKLFRRQVIFQSLLAGQDDIKSLMDAIPVFLRSFHLRLFRKLDFYHAINPIFVERYLEQIPDEEKILLCPQGLNEEIFKPYTKKQKKQLRLKMGIEEERLIILSVGFVIERKGHKEVIRELANCKMNFQYFIAGEYGFGKDHFLYNQRIESDKIVQIGKDTLGEKIVFTGGIRHIVDYYQVADIVVLNSEQEGLSNVLLEAMASGCAVLVRDLPGLDGFIIHHLENGILYQEGKDIPFWIKKLSEDPGFRAKIGQKAARDILNTATFNHFINLMEDKLAKGL